jgi:hypothetical protein
VPEDELWQHAHNADKYQRAYQTVQSYTERIIYALRNEDVTADVWCVVIPEYIYLNCRPNSSIPAEERVHPEATMGPKMVRKHIDQQSLFPDLNELAEQYLYAANFHHQLKARLLKYQIPTQIVRETKIAYREFVNTKGELIYPLEKQESAIAWNLASAVFYKAGGRPWKLNAIREGVCYIGLAFKQVNYGHDPRTACCAAQMFLDSGDGVVFKGAIGPWYRGKRGLYHLDRNSAKEVVEKCVSAYTAKNNGIPPKELFIHGRIALDDDEWAGFLDGVGPETKVIGVRIRPDSNFKLYRLGDHPVLRGIAYLLDDRRGFLWTRGMVPRLRTYPGREVPNPVLVDVCRGNADIRTVMTDILALTKLNYNACTFADGLPVTLKFADAIGDILTSGPARKLDVPPLPFRYYI